MKNKLFILAFSLILVITAVSFFAFKSINAESKSIGYESIHCVLGDKDGIDKMEIYYDFLDKKVYKFSIISTNPLTENIDVEKYKRVMNDMNAKHPGYSAKLWHDHEKKITIESYYLDLYTEEEFQKALMMSKKELQSKSREEILESIVPMGENTNFSCN